MLRLRATVQFAVLCRSCLAEPVLDLQGDAVIPRPTPFGPLIILAGMLASPAGTQVLEIVSSFPPDGAIDARQPSNLDGSNPVGWDSIELTFDGDASGLTPEDFTVCSTVGSAPTVDSVMSDGNIVTLTLSGFIPPGAWTVFMHNASGTASVLAYLPAVMNGDGTAASIDILHVIDGLNGVLDPPLAIWQCDVARSGMCVPSDILRVIDLLNGAEAFDAWNGVSLGPVPETCPEVEVSFSPLTGPVGRAITITIDPAVPPLAFDASTTATWTGVYEPPTGPPSDPFEVVYDASQFRELSTSQAIIVVGGGTVSGAPNPEGLDGLGAFVGTLSINLAGGTVTGTMTFALESDAATWEMVTYPYDPMGPPTIDGEPDELQQLLLSELPDPNNPSEELLLAANDFHFAAVVRIDENSSTAAYAPATILVDLVSFDSNEIEIDRLEDVVLHRLDPGGDPDYLVYHNDLTIPIVLVDTALNNADYPNALLLYVLTDGTAGIFPVLD